MLSLFVIEFHKIIGIGKKCFYESQLMPTVWQQLEGIKKNMKVSETKLDNGPARKTAMFFNRLPRRIRKITGVATKTFKGHLDKWLDMIPDEPGEGGYQGRRAAKTNSVIDQSATKQ